MMRWTTTRIPESQEAYLLTIRSNNKSHDLVHRFSSVNYILSLVLFGVLFSIYVTSIKLSGSIKRDQISRFAFPTHPWEISAAHLPATLPGPKSRPKSASVQLVTFHISHGIGISHCHQTKRAPNLPFDPILYFSSWTATYCIALKELFLYRCYIIHCYQAPRKSE